MFNSYNDAHLMNESYVFYTTSTNTFRNPAYAALDGEDGDENCHDIKTQGKQRVQQMPPSSGAAAAAANKQDSGETPQTTKQRLIDFCDNFAFTMRGKMFIMETNLKRKLRGLRRFLDKRVLPRRRWWISSPVRRRPNVGGHSDHDHHHDQISASSSLRDLIGNERNSSLSARCQFATGVEPVSAKALGFQQELILNRLQRIKRDSQRLFNMQHATIMESDNETGAGAEEAGEVGVANYSQLTLDAPLAKSTTPSSHRFSMPVWLTRSKSSQTAVADSKLSRKTLVAQLPTHAELETTRAGRGRGQGSSWAVISRGKQTAKQVAAAYSLSNPKKTCIVCYERAPNIVTLPCEHSDICSDCFIEIIYMAVKSSQYPLRCVLCRQKVERIRCSRRLMLSVIKRNRRSSGGKTGGKGGGGTKSSEVGCRLQF